MEKSKLKEKLEKRQEEHSRKSTVFASLLIAFITIFFGIEGENAVSIFFRAVTAVNSSLFLIRAISYYTRYLSIKDKLLEFEED